MGTLYDQKSEAAENQVHATDKLSGYTSAVSVQDTAGAVQGITTVHCAVEQYTKKSAHEVFKSLVNASTCANIMIEKKLDGFYIIIPGSFYELL